MTSAKVIFEWAKQNGEVKSVDRILVKVMLLLIKYKIILTPVSVISKYDGGLMEFIQIM